MIVLKSSIIIHGSLNSWVGMYFPRCALCHLEWNYLKSSGIPNAQKNMILFNSLKIKQMCISFLRKNDNCSYLASPYPTTRMNIVINNRVLAGLLHNAQPEYGKHNNILYIFQCITIIQYSILSLFFERSPLVRRLK